MKSHFWRGQHTLNADEYMLPISPQRKNIFLFQSQTQTTIEYIRKNGETTPTHGYFSLMNVPLVVNLKLFSMLLISIDAHNLQI